MAAQRPKALNPTGTVNRTDKSELKDVLNKDLDPYRILQSGTDAVPNMRKPLEWLSEFRTYVDRANLQAWFNEIDVNKKGFLSKNEFLALIAARNELQHLRSPSFVDMMFELADAKGSINFEDFCEIWGFMTGLKHIWGIVAKDTATVQECYNLFKYNNPSMVKILDNANYHPMIKKFLEISGIGQQDKDLLEVRLDNRTFKLFWLFIGQCLSYAEHHKDINQWLYKGAPADFKTEL
jgi:hypothetical protein